MGEDQPSPSSSRRKHRRSSDDELDHEPKRRKHHHHRSHHRRHRHHSRHKRYRDEEELEETISMQKRVEHASHKKPVDDEREEGEILEDEEGGEGAVLAVEADSEVESGEIKMELEVPIATKRPSCEEDPVSDNNVGNLNAENDMNKLKYCFVKENDRDGSFLFETTEDTSKYIGEYGDLAEREARKESKQSNKAPQKEKHKDIYLHDFRSRKRPRSPASRESSYLLNHTDKDDHHTAENAKSNPKCEQGKDKNGGSVYNDGSLSPKISKEKDRETVQSSSSSKYYCEFSNRDQSLSDDRTSGRLPDQAGGHDAEESIPLRQSERQIKGRNSADHESSGRFDRLDRYTGRGREVDKEAHNERECSVYSRHDGHNSRHSSRDRGTEGVNRRHGSRERAKEVGRSCSGYRDRDNQQTNKGARRDWERSHISSRYGEREDMHGSRDREWDRGRERDKYSNIDRERERKIDRSRDRVRESDSIRNVKGERERERDDTNRNKSLCRKTHSLEYRERVDQIERGRSSNHNRHRDSRQSNYNDKERREERTKSNEFSKYSTCNIHESEEEKKNCLRDEDEDDYQGRIEQQLAKQDEEDIEKIKEESRKRRQAILEKYKEQQKQQHVEPPHNTLDKEELISNVQDDMQQVHESIDGVSTTAFEELVEQHDPSDAYVVDPSFTVGKSPVLNGLSVPEMTATVGGLGEGSPKVK